MKKFTVLNVGQGDSIIISPETCSEHKNKVIFVDLGNGVKDVLAHNPDKKQIILSISHSHTDHIGGLKWIVDHHSDITEIWLPYYFDEIVVFVDFILDLKGVKNLPLDFSLLQKAKGAFYSSTLLVNLSKAFNIPIVGLHNSQRICHHIKILNPQIKVEKNLGLSIQRLEQYIELAKKSNLSEFEELIDNNEFKNFRNKILYPSEYRNIPGLTNEIDNERRKRLLLGLLYKNKRKMQKFVNNPTTTSFRNLYVSAEKDINNLSTIIHFKDENDDALFTGDVSASLLNRIKRDGALPQTKILKIPHHGSKYSISRKILEHIKPKIAIVSHKNGIFGRQIDPHPNKEVIDMLDALNIRTLYTNDVIKNIKTIKFKPKREHYNKSIDYIDRW